MRKGRSPKFLAWVPEQMLAPSRELGKVRVFSVTFPYISVKLCPVLVGCSHLAKGAHLGGELALLVASQAAGENQAHSGGPVVYGSSSGIWIFICHQDLSASGLFPCKSSQKLFF